MAFILTSKQATNAKPIIKWLGGKSRLLPQLLSLIPDTYNTYYEPFIGGGALFFSLAIHDAVINDLNPHLINLYTQVRDNLDELIFHINKIQIQYLSLAQEVRSDFYYDCRDEFNQRPDNDVRGAVLFLFLNKTCYNGVYRENSSGKFNVPFGRRKSATLYDYESMKHASELLKHTVIHNSSYEKALIKANKGDFIYLDPPYVPLSSTSNFTQYIGSDFGNKEHIILRDIVNQLAAKGCYVMVSNSDTKVVRDLYEGFNFTQVLADRNVNCKSHGRGKITELVITNY